MSNFHTSAAWVKLAGIHKLIEKARGNYRCADCKTTNDLQSDHVLCVSKYPAYGLNLGNLTLRCGPEAKGCNQKKGDKFYWSIRAVKLWIIYRATYTMITVLKYISLAILLIILGRLLYLDRYNNASTLTNQLQYEMILYWEKLQNLS